MLLLLSHFSRINSVRPHRPQPTRLPSPWDSPGKNTGAGCHLLLQCMKVKSESEVAQLCRLLTTPWTTAHQAHSSMGFSRQEYRHGVPLPSLHYMLVASESLQNIIFSILKSFASPPIFCFHTMMHTCLLTLKLVYSNFPPVL